VLDTNRDGKVDRNEMLRFLEAKNVDMEHRAEIVDEIFSKCDADHNGFIELSEFVEYYMKTKTQLEARNREQDNQIRQIYYEIQALENSKRAITTSSIQPNTVFFKMGQLHFEPERDEEGTYTFVFQSGTETHSEQVNYVRPQERQERATVRFNQTFMSLITRDSTVAFRVEFQGMTQFLRNLNYNVLLQIVQNRVDPTELMSLSMNDGSATDLRGSFEFIQPTSHAISEKLGFVQQEIRK